MEFFGILLEFRMKRPSSSTKTMPYPQPSWGRPGGPGGGYLHPFGDAGSFGVLTFEH